MRTGINHIKLLALRYFGMFWPSKVHLQGVLLKHFRRQISKMCIKCKIQFIDMQQNSRCSINRILQLAHILLIWL